VQVTTKFEGTVNGPTVCVPEVASGPVHAPEAAQLVALVLDHVSCTD
jgi:hypothetical protein